VKKKEVRKKMGAAKAIGGILGLVSGVLVLLVALDLMIGLGIFGLTATTMTYAALILLYGTTVIYINLVIAIIALLGGILGLAGKKAGGGLALAAGIIWLIGGFLIASVPYLLPFSAIMAWTDQIIIISMPNVYFISIEAILCLVGGIMILAGGSD